MEALEGYYRILGLEPGASLEEVKQAYRDLVNVWHPDRFAHDPRLQKKAEEKLREINDAYEQLQSRYGRHPSRESRWGSEAIQPFAPESPSETDESRQESLGKRWAAAIAVILVLLLVVVLFSQISVPSKRRAPKETPSIASPSSLTTSPPGKYVPSQIENEGPTRERSFSVKETEEKTYQEHRGQREHRISWQPAVPNGYFGIGSTKDDVLTVQGEPSIIIRDAWYYRDSSIDFYDDQVSGYANISKNLKVRLLPKADASEAESLGYFTIGSTKDEVLAVQGTPTSVIKNTWYYRDSSVDFHEDQVSGYANISKNLKVRLLPKADASEAESLGYFTIGSTKDEVVAIQGTPTNIIKNTWYYKDSSVDFYEDQVSGYFNISKNLKVRLKHRPIPENELKIQTKGLSPGSKGQEEETQPLDRAR